MIIVRRFCFAFIALLMSTSMVSADVVDVQLRRLFTGSAGINLAGGSSLVRTIGGVTEAPVAVVDDGMPPNISETLNFAGGTASATATQTIQVDFDFDGNGTTDALIFDIVASNGSNPDGAGGTTPANIAVGGQQLGVAGGGAGNGIGPGSSLTLSIANARVEDAGGTSLGTVDFDGYVGIETRLFNEAANATLSVVDSAGSTETLQQDRAGGATGAGGAATNRQNNGISFAPGDLVFTGLTSVDVTGTPLTNGLFIRAIGLDFTFTAVAVPEPSSAMLLLGLTAITGVCRRRKLA